LAFVLAAEIRKAGIGVTVTNGRANVYALAKKIRSESLGYRQLWIIGDPALEACGEYAELANWPASQRTDYYNLAGGDFTATCRRAAELADEKAEEGVGRKFLEAMGDMEPTEPALRPPAQDEEREVEEEYRYKRREEEGQEEEEYRYRRREEWAREDEEDRDYLETPTEEREEVEYRHRRREEEGQEEDGHRDGRDDQPDVPETVEEFTDEELEEIGREFLKLFSRIRENRTPRRESKPHVGKEEH
jgi:hypothetical protein